MSNKYLATPDPRGDPAAAACAPYRDDFDTSSAVQSQKTLIASRFMCTIIYLAALGS